MNNNISMCSDVKDDIWYYAIESSGDGVWDWDVKTSKVHYSLQWKKMLGYSDSEIKDELAEWKKLIHPADIKAVEKSIGDYMNGNKLIYEMEYRLLCKNNKYKWILSRGKIVKKDDEGKPLRIVGTHIDITKRKKTQLLLNKKKDQQRALLDNIPFLLWLKNKDGIFEEVNILFADSCGLSVNEISGKTDFDIWPRELADKYTAADADVINTGQKITLEELIQNPDGMRWFETYKAPVFNVKGEVVGTTGFSRDITERKQIDSVLLKKDRILFAVAMCIEELLVSDSVDETIPFCLEELGKAANVDRVYLFRNYNDEDGKLYTTQTDEWTSEYTSPQSGSEHVTFVSLDSVPEILNAGIRKRVFSGLVREMSTPLKNALEPQNIKSIIIIPVHFNNQFWGFVGFDDCRKERTWNEAEKNILSSFASALGAAVQRELAADELKIARSSADAANAEKSRFLANISHELRTPLNAIIGISKTLMNKENSNLSERQTEGLSIINESGNRLLLLINDILDLSKIEARKMTPVYTDFKLTEVISAQLSILGHLVSGKPIKILSDISPEVPDFINSDRGKIEQILTNLSGNAAKFTEEGSISIRAFVNNSMISVTIEDTGIGIPKAETKKVFDQFYQAEHYMTKKHSGSGLGLPLSKKLAQLLGGNIFLESNENLGTKVTFIFPFFKPTQSGKPDAMSQFTEKPPSEKLNVFIVDDENINRMTLSMILDGEFNLFFASSGHEFLQFIKEKKPDVVLMDIMMPEMDGIETMKIFHSMPEYLNIPVIAVTARAMTNEKESIIEKGFSGYVSKPVDENLLINLIKKTAGKQT